MAENDFSQAPKENEKDRLEGWRDNIQESVFGPEGSGGNLDGKNITNIADPEDITLSTVSVDSSDASNLATVITLANEMKGDINTLVADVNNGFTKINVLLTELRDTLELFS